MATIHIAYGQTVPGYLLGSASRTGNRYHLIPAHKLAAYEYPTVCGMTVWGAEESATGTICPDCAKAADVRSCDLVGENEFEGTVVVTDEPKPTCPLCGWGDGKHASQCPRWATVEA